MKKRFALILGAASSGTGRLFRRLGSHPQVIPCRVKEPRFFTDERKWSLGLDWYRSLWDFREPDERIAIEASTDYSQHPRIPCPAERVAQTPAGFRFLYLMRNPLERIEAQHAADWEAGRAEGTLRDGVLERHIDVSRYASQLAHWRERFSAEDFLLLRSEELEREPGAVLTRAARFLEIDPFIAHPGAEEQPDPTAPRPASGWWDRLQRLAGVEAGPASDAPDLRFRLSAQQRSRVLEELRGELARLETEWGFDVSAWHLEG